MPENRRPMRILAAPANYLHSDRLGSECCWSHEIITNLAKKGYEVTAIVGIDETSQLSPTKTKLYSIFKKRSQNALKEVFHKLKFSYAYYRIGKKLLKEEQIDIVHHMLPSSDVAYNLLPLLKATKGKPFIMGPFQPRAEMGSYRDFRHYLGIRKGLFSRGLYLSLPLSYRLFHSLFKRTIKKAERIICVNRRAKEYYCRYIDESRVRVIPVGIDVHRFIPKRRKEEGSQINLLAVGYFVTRKGFAVLFKALSNLTNKYPNLRLKIVGRGYQEEELKRSVQELGLKGQVEFCGFVPHTQIESYYQESDIFCNPTMDEPFGQVNLEAMACGLPIVGTKVGALPEIITPEVGILIEKNNPKEMARAIEHLIENKEKRLQMGENARKRVEKFYSWDHIVDQYLKLYEDVLAECKER